MLAKRAAVRRKRLLLWVGRGTQLPLHGELRRHRGRVQQALRRVGRLSGASSLKEAIKTFGALAFSIADQPDRVDEAQVKSLFGDNPALGLQAGVKRLGLTHSLQDLKLRSDPDASCSRPLPTLEREAKRSNQETRLTGVLIEGELEPSHALMDKAAAMLQDGVVRYIPPSACVSRDTELASGKKGHDFVSLEGGTLSIKRKDTPQNTDVSTDYRLQQAFTSPAEALPSTASTWSISTCTNAPRANSSTLPHVRRLAATTSQPFGTSSARIRSSVREEHFVQSSGPSWPGPAARAANPTLRIHAPSTILPRRQAEPMLCGT